MQRNSFVFSLLALGTLLLMPALLVAAGSDGLSFRPSEISSGARATMMAPVRGPAEVSQKVAPESTQPPLVEGLQPGVGFKAYNFDDNAALNGGFLFIPPDPIGAAGPSQVIAVVNVGIESRDKTGVLQWRSSLQNFFSPLGAATLGTFTFDPKILYDHHENRFVVVTLERTDVTSGGASDESRILLAVSKTANPASSGPADWWFAAINSKLTISGTPGWADYPGFEVDEEAIYITANYFGFGSSGFPGLGPRLWIVNKGVVGGFYAGGAASFASYDPVPAGFFGLTLMPAEVFGAGGAGAGIGTYLVGYSSLTFGGPGAPEAVQVIRVSNPLGVPTFAGEFVTVGDLEDVGGVFGFPALPDAPQSGTTTLIEVNDSRALDAVWRNNRLWFTTTINPNVAQSPPDVGQATAHWFELDTSTFGGAGTGVVQQGNIGGEDITPGPDEVWTFFPSVAVNSLGEAKFGFSASASTIFAGAYVTGRKPTDALGTVRPTGTVQPGLDSYVRTFSGTRNRWGDYSGIALDPSDDRVFWVFNEYAELRGTPTGTPPQDGRWGTAWLQCAMPCVSVTCNIDLVVGQGSNFPLQMCITNCGGLKGDFDYTITDTQGWCAGSAGTVTLDPGATTCITVNCSVPAGATPGSMNFITLTATPVTGGASDAATCTTKITVDATVPVSIEGFQAVSNADGVRLEWKLGPEWQDQLTGLRVQRAEAEAGPYQDLDAELHPAGAMSWLDTTVEPGRDYWYRLVTLADDGIGMAGPIRVSTGDAFLGTALESPFVPADGGPVQIRYSLSGRGAAARLEVFDVRGRRVRTLLPAGQGAGRYVTTWNRLDDNGQEISRGVYFVHLNADGQRLSRKLVLLRR